MSPVQTGQPLKSIIFADVAAVSNAATVSQIVAFDAEHTPHAATPRRKRLIGMYDEVDGIAGRWRPSTCLDGDEILLAWLYGN